MAVLCVPYYAGMQIVSIFNNSIFTGIHVGDELPARRSAKQSAKLPIKTLGECAVCE